MTNFNETSGFFNVRSLRDPSKIRLTSDVKTVLVNVEEVLQLVKSLGNPAIVGICVAVLCFCLLISFGLYLKKCRHRVTEMTRLFTDLGGSNSEVEMSCDSNYQSAIPILQTDV